MFDSPDYSANSGNAQRKLNRFRSRILKIYLCTSTRRQSTGVDGVDQTTARTIVNWCRFELVAHTNRKLWLTNWLWESVHMQSAARSDSSEEIFEEKQNTNCWLSSSPPRGINADCSARNFLNDNKLLNTTHDYTPIAYTLCSMCEPE